MVTKDGQKKRTEINLQSKLKLSKKQTSKVNLTSSVAVQCENKHGLSNEPTCRDIWAEKQCVGKLTAASTTVQNIDRSQSPLLPWEEFNSTQFTDQKMQKQTGTKTKLENKLSSTLVKNKTNFLKKNVLKVKQKQEKEKREFHYYTEHSKYASEYRKRQLSLLSNYDGDDGFYTKQDIQRFYSEYKTYPKAQLKPLKHVNSEKSLTRNERIDKLLEKSFKKECAEDSTEEPTLESEFDLTPYTNIKLISDDDKLLSSHEDMEMLVDRHDFFGWNYKNDSRLTTRCPVIDIAIPEDHTISRLAKESLGSGKSRETNLSCIDELAVSEWGANSSGPDTGSAFYSNAVSPINKTPSFTPSIQTSVSGLNTAVRDLQPFSRNGIMSRAKIRKTIKRNVENKSVMSKNSSSGYGSQIDETNQSTGEKQSAPWKALHYLGYKPSMRKYLKEIYTPIKKERSLSSASVANKEDVIISGKPISVSPQTEINSLSLHKPVGNQPSPLPNNKSTASKKHSNMQDLSAIHSIIERRLLGAQRFNNTLAISHALNAKPTTTKKTNLAIVSNFKTVVRAPVTNKHVTAVN